MKRNLLFLAMLAWLLPLGAQGLGSSGSSLAQPRLYIKGKEKAENFMKINYEVTVPGYIELHLIKRKWNSDKGEYDEATILIRGKVTENREKGERYYRDYVSFPTSPLDSSASYRYELRYKGDTYSGTI